MGNGCSVLQVPILRPEPQHLPYLLTVRAASGEGIECSIFYANNMPGDLLRPLRRAILRVLQPAPPFKHAPAGKIVLRHLRKDRPKTDLPIAQRTEPPRAIHPTGITAIHPLPAVRTKLCILHMER